MERMWRKVNHSFTGRNSKSTSTIQSTDTASSAGGFGDGQIVVAVAGISSASGYLASNNNILPSSTATGRRLAASGQMPIPISGGSSGNAQQKSLSQHVLLGSTASSERRRRRRRKSRARRSACVGGGADNMSSSGGFYSKDSTNKRHHHQQPQHQQQHQHQQYSSNGLTTMASTSAPSGTVMMYPNIDVTTISGDGGRVGSFDVGAGGGNSGNVTAIREGTSISVATTIAAAAAAAAAAEAVATTAQPDISLRQRAVAKLRMFNFHLNWDLHMTHCKPCGPRIGSGGSGGGNIITRRLCRNRRREDNELYRSNSFKFERFERKEYIEELSDTLQKKIAICDDYSLPIDFVKKRPSSFDPCLAETIPNPETWTAPSPLSDFVAFADQQQQQNQQGPIPPPSVAASTSASACPTIILSAAPSTQQQQPQQQQHQFQFPLHHHHTSLHQHQKQNQQQQQQQQQKSHHYSLHHKNPKLQRSHHPPLPHPTIKQASVKIVEGYSDPKDSKRPKKVYHKKSKRRRSHHVNTAISNTSRRNNINNNNNNSNSNNNNSHCEPASSRDKRSNYSSDSSAPKSSDDDDDNDNDEDNQSIKVPELNSPDSISEDLVRPLPIQLHRSPRKLTTGNGVLPENSKRNPSPYYYSDLLKPKDALGVTTATDKETKNKSRQSTSSEPPQLTQPQVVPEVYRKSTSLDVPEQRAGEDSFDNHGAESEVFDETPPQPAPAQATLPQPALSPQSHHTKDITPKRYSFTEDGVRIIRCTTPSTSTSDDSDCSECQKRREWHARALALVRKTCNIVVPADYCDGGGCEDDTAPIISSTKHNNPGDELIFLPFDSETSSMPPHRLLGPAVCACVAPTIGDDLDEYFKPRSIFYVHPQGVHECSDCSPDLKVAAEKASRKKNSNNKKNEEGQKDEGDNDDDEDDNDDDEEDDMSSGRTRQIYETAFDCKIAKSDDDLDEVDRIENHSVLLQLNNGNNVVLPPTKTDHNRSSSRTRESSGCGGKSRMEGKRLKNSKNQALQEKATTTTTTTGSAVSEAVTTTTTKTTTAPSTIGTTNTADPITGALSAELENSHIHNDDGVDQMNNATSSSQLPMRGYTPSPPSTAPLPIKFPAKHDRFFMNSIKSAPNLPSSNSVHPRLKDLRLPIQSSLRLHQQQQQQNQQQQYPGSSSLLGGSNDNSLADSGLYPPPSMKVPSSSSSSAHHHHYPLSHHIKATATSSASSKTRDRPRSFVLEAGRVLELRKSHHSSSHHHHNHHHHVANGTGGGGGGSNVPGRRQQNYSSTESIATSSSGGSMESLRSSTSEGNRSTSSSESRHSTSLSSHSSESGSSSVAFPLRAPIVLHSKLHILSPISDKSSQEPASDASELNKTQNVSPEDAHQQQQQHQLESNQLKVAGEVHSTNQTTGLDGLKKRRPPTNKTLLHLADEILGSDSGISLHSREDGKPTSGIHRFTLPKLNFSPSDKLANNENGACGGAGGGTTGNSALPQDLHELPFDMPKLRRRKTMQQDACTSGSATSVDLGDLPFDMPKLRRRLRMNQTEISNLMVQSTESSGISQASSSHSMRDDNKVSIKLDNTAIFRQNLTLNLNEPRPTNKFGSLDLRGTASNKELNLNLNTGIASAVDLIDITIPLERQGWYHGAITRIEAETTLRPLSEGSFLVRNCESTKQDFSLSLKGAKGFMHMRIQRNDSGQYILGQFSRPFDSVPEMIRHFCLNRLPVRGAEHMCLIDPVIAQLL